MNALRNTHIYLNYTCLLWLFKDRPEVVQGLKHLESMNTQLPSAVVSHTVFRTTRTAAHCEGFNTYLYHHNSAVKQSRRWI